MPNIFKALVPDKVFDRFELIPFDELFNSGKTCLFLDYDNTLGPDRSWEPNQYSIDMVNKLKQIGFSLCLVSNAKSERSSGLAQKLDIPCVTYAKKPRTDGINRALKLMNVDKSNVVMIGDQVFTDVLAGNLAGITSYLIEKYDSKEIWYVKIKRPFEKIVRIIARF